MIFFCTKMFIKEITRHPLARRVPSLESIGMGNLQSRSVSKALKVLNRPLQDHKNMI